METSDNDKCGVKLETLCMIFASLNIVFKLALLTSVISFLTKGEITLSGWATIHDPFSLYSPGELFISPYVLISICILSIIFSAALILGVELRSHRTLKVYLVFAIVSLILSAMKAIWGLLVMVIHGDLINYQVWLLALMAAVIYSVQVYWVYKLYKKFRRDNVPKRLVDEPNQERTHESGIE